MQLADQSGAAGANAAVADVPVTLTEKWLSDACAHQVKLYAPQTAKGAIRYRSLAQAGLLRSYVPPDAPAFGLEHQVFHHQDGKQVFLVGFVRCGTLSLDSERRSCAVKAGDILVYGNDGPYMMDVSSGFDGLWVRIPQQLLSRHRTLLKYFSGQCLDGSLGMSHVFGQTLAAALDCAGLILPDSLHLLENSLLEMVAATLNDKLGSLPDGRSNPTLYSLLLLQRAQSYIFAHLGDEDLGPGAISAALGISSRRLHELFQQSGTNVGDWVLKERLERCHRKLTAMAPFREPIGTIAYENGFKNISHFNRVFKTHYGATPSQIRNRAAG